MTPEQWSRVKALFEQALDLPPEERQAWLAAQAGADAVLRREVEALLRAHATEGTFLQHPPATTGLHVFPAGTLLGRYEILDELGRGGGGIVYLAHDHVLGRRVALKLVASGADPEMRERLRLEARAAANIAHPAIAAVHTLEEFDDQLFIVSEYVRGRTLRSVLSEGALPREEAVRIAKQIAGALRAAHDAGVVHRDLKPENVLLSETGDVKVVDFGIARVIDSTATQLTREGALLGTPAYMAPEQLLGTAADARADIYAFGIVLAEMLTGRHPGLPGTANPDSSAARGLTLIARQCTELDPAARFQTAALLLAALERAESGRDTTRSNARWWWEFHQAVVATVYWVTLWPAWHARQAIGGPLGRSFFIVIVGAVVVSACLRWHLWFTSRFYPDELSWARRRSATWVAAGDAVLAAALVSAALLIRDEHSSLDVVLLSIGLGTAVAFLLIEAATTRAAFGGGR